MSASPRIRRGVAVALAVGSAISLTVLPQTPVPALAQPDTDTTVPGTVEVAPPVEVTPEPTVEIPTAPPQTQAPVEQPVTQAPVEPTAPPVTQATIEPTVQPTPEPTVEPTTAAPTATQTPEPTPAEPTTAEPTSTMPETTAAEPTTAATTATSAPQTTSAQETTSAPQTTPATTTGSASPSTSAPSTTPTSGTATSTTADTSTSATSGTTAPSTTSAAETTTESGSSSTTEEAAQVTPISEPERLQASAQDLAAAKASVPVQKDPNPAPPNEIESILNKVTEAVDAAPAAATPASAAEAAELTTKVLQFQPDWVQYDQFFRPVIYNPFPDPLQIVYTVAGASRVLLIPALASVVTEVAALGAYSFTAMVLSAAGIPYNVAVGNFFGGGYQPAPGQPPPPPPPPVTRYDDVPVVVRYTNQTYKPFRVQQIVDVGEDPAVGERKVLLDGATPAWGAWVENANGERQFEVHKTQQFPGMEAPSEGPLPGDYQLLAAESPSSGLSTKDVVLIAVAVVVALVGVGAIVYTVMMGRRRRRV